MTLRSRLVVALGVLLAVGLATFGAATTTLYTRAQYSQLDQSLRDSAAAASALLREKAGLGDGGHDEGGPLKLDTPQGGGPTSTERAPGGPDAGGDGSLDKDRRGPTIVLPTGTYAELFDPSGASVTRLQVTASTEQPAVPDDLPSTGTTIRTVGSATDAEGSTPSTQWRLYASPNSELTGYRNVVAIPTAGLERERRRLLLIEFTAAAGLLAVLAGGSWLILRRGLRPLERMADAAHLISAGDLSQRVSPADERSEVGQLGIALNTMLDEIEQAFRERDATEARLRQFLSDASHELRTPLTSIQGFAELFRLAAKADQAAAAGHNGSGPPAVGRTATEANAPSETTADRPAGPNLAAGASIGDGSPTAMNQQVNLPVIMRRIEQESARMRGLVEDLLLLARLDERRPSQRGTVDLSVLAADACSDAVAAGPGRPILLHAADSVPVEGDSDHLRQAIANLMANALRHTPADATIDGTTETLEGRAVLTVRDHGPGLDADALTHAFDRFWQADRARVGTGAGLGLSIVAAIASEHHGTITASNHPQGGAQFRLELPLAAGALSPR